MLQPLMLEKWKKKWSVMLKAKLSKNGNRNKSTGNTQKRIGEKDVDQQMTIQWLKTAGLKSETECFIIAVQDQAIKTNY